MLIAPTPDKPKTTPFLEGDPSAQICLVGEAPSFTEIKDNRPFCGPAGQLLDRCLHASGIMRSRCYITNVFEEPVTKPKDDGSKIFSKDGVLLWTYKNGFTEAGMAASYNSFQRVRDCKANIIIPMGGPALTLCLDSRSVTKWRGSILPGGEQINHRKILPTIHPSGALKGVYQWRYLIVSDLKKAKRESAYPEIRPLARKLLIDPSFKESMDFLTKCYDHKSFNTDIEVFQKQVDCFSLAVDDQEAMCIPLLDANYESRFSLFEERQIWDMYARLIGDPDVEKINQNIVFDLAALYQLNKIVPRGRIQDPMVAHSVMYPFLEKNLGTICSMTTDEPYYKDDGLLSASHTIDDLRRRWEYNAKDSYVSMQAWMYYKPLLQEEDYSITYENLTLSLVSSLIYMMNVGIKVNYEQLLKTRDESYIKLAAIVDRATQVFGRMIIDESPKTSADFKKLYSLLVPGPLPAKIRIKDMKEVVSKKTLLISSNPQLMSYFYGEKRIKPYMSDQGRPTIDDLALSRIVRRFELEEARVVQEYRKLSKLISTYLEMGYDSDNRVRCSFNIRGTWTGRLSSSQTIFDTGGNFQNLTEDFQCFLETSATRPPNYHIEEMENSHNA